MTIAILSWGARKTLRNSLESYKKYGLDEMDRERIIFFQEITNEDRAIAEEFGYQAFGSETNLGIAGGYKSLVEKATGDLFLFLENDWELLEKPWVPIITAGNILKEEDANVIRFRHRMNPGHPLWSKGYQGRELDNSTHLLDSIHWTDPSKFGLIWQEMDYPSWYFAWAKNANWTNNPTMFKTDWLREHILPRMEGDIEKSLQSWWREQGWVVAQGEGLFTHNRLD